MWMCSVRFAFSRATLGCLLLVTLWVWQTPDTCQAEPTSETASISANPEPLSAEEAPRQRSSRREVLIASLTIFLLAVFVGFEVVTKVPTTLHTPLMSGSNAISGITIVGAVIAAGAQHFSISVILGTAAVVLAAINVVGGFMITHRMLGMFQRKK